MSPEAVLPIFTSPDVPAVVALVPIFGIVKAASPPVALICNLLNFLLASPPITPSRSIVPAPLNKVSAVVPDVWPRIVALVLLKLIFPSSAVPLVPLVASVVMVTSPLITTGPVNWTCSPPVFPPLTNDVIFPVKTIPPLAALLDPLTAKSPIPVVVVVPTVPSVVVAVVVIVTVSLDVPSRAAIVTAPVPSISRFTSLESFTAPPANSKELAPITKSASPAPAGLVTVIVSLPVPLPVVAVNLVVPPGLYKTPSKMILLVLLLPTVSAPVPV